MKQAKQQRVSGQFGWWTRKVLLMEAEAPKKRVSVVNEDGSQIIPAASTLVHLKEMYTLKENLQKGRH